jgi:hypothetical protein
MSLLATLKTYGLGYYGDTCCNGNGISNCESDPDDLNRCARDGGHGLSSLIGESKKVDITFMSPQQSNHLFRSALNIKPPVRSLTPKVVYHMPGVF